MLFLIILCDLVNAMIKVSVKCSTRCVPINLGNSIDYWLLPKIFLTSIRSVFKELLPPMDFPYKEPAMWSLDVLLVVRLNIKRYCVNSDWWHNDMRRQLNICHAMSFYLYGYHTIPPNSGQRGILKYCGICVWNYRMIWEYTERECSDRNYKIYKLR